jgi:hypothetical protein
MQFPEEEKVALIRKLFSIEPAKREIYIQSVLSELQHSTSKDEVLQCLNELFECIDLFKLRLN